MAWTCAQRSWLRATNICPVCLWLPAGPGDGCWWPPGMGDSLAPSHGSACFCWRTSWSGCRKTEGFHVTSHQGGHMWKTQVLTPECEQKGRWCGMSGEHECYSTAFRQQRPFSPRGPECCLNRWHRSDCAQLPVPWKVPPCLKIGYKYILAFAVLENGFLRGEGWLVKQFVSGLIFFFFSFSLCLVHILLLTWNKVVYSWAELLNCHWCYWEWWFSIYLYPPIRKWWTVMLLAIHTHDHLKEPLTISHNPGFLLSQKAIKILIKFSTVFIGYNCKYPRMIRRVSAAFGIVNSEHLPKHWNEGKCWHAF